MPSEIKPISDLNRVALSSVIPIATPFSIYAFVTNFCNFKCNYCAHSLGVDQMKQEYDFNHETMTLETFKAIIDQLKQFPQKVKVISLTGHGEPLLNKELVNMIGYAKDSNVSERIEFITNASILSETLSKEIISAGLDCIRISLQGMTSKKYFEVCGYRLDFNELVDNITYFYRERGNCKVYVKMMDIALALGEDEKFYNTFRDISDRMYIEQCRPVYSGVEKTKNISTTADRYGRAHLPRSVCPLCFYMLGVLPNGDVKPCDAIYKPVILGNVNSGSLVDMWRGSVLAEFQTLQLKGQRNNLYGCRSCCAPDDVSHPQDQLDEAASKILERLQYNE